MKQQVLTVMAFTAIMFVNKSYAQSWNGSGISTVTSGPNPKVGIGLSTPNCELDILHHTTPGGPGVIPGGLHPAQSIHEEYFGAGTYEAPSSWGHEPFNIFEIKQTTSRSGPFMIPPTRNCFFVQNSDVATKVGINIATANHTLDVGGEIRASATIYGQDGNFSDVMTVGSRIDVNNGRIHLNNSSDHDRVIQANTTTGALNMLAGTDGSDAGIRLFGRNGLVPGGIHYITRGTSATETAHQYVTFDGSNWNTILEVKKNGKIIASNLAGTGNRMVVADATGALSTTGITTYNYTLDKLAGNIRLLNHGSPVSSVPDGLGDHQGQATLDMNNNNITEVKDINLVRILFNGTGMLTANSAWDGLNTNNKFEVGGSNVGSEKFYVNGTSKLNGNVNVVGVLDASTDLRVAGSTVTSSDRRFKENIVSLNEESTTEKLMRVGTYQYSYRKFDESSRWKFDDKKHFGFIAQEVQEIFPDLVRSMDDEKDGYLGVNYTEFIPMLLQAIKEENQQIQQQQAVIDQLQGKVNTLETEKTNTAGLQNKLAELEKQMAALNNLSAKLDAQQATINALQNKLAEANEANEVVNSQQKTINKLQNKISIMEADMNLCCQARSTHTGDVQTPAMKSSLDQNVPNPFNGETRIGFSIVGEYQSAFIGIYDLNGRHIRQIPVIQGSNHIMFNNENMMPGMYVYSLIVDQQLIDSKKMIIAE